jgi:ferredoxin
VEIRRAMANVSDQFPRNAAGRYYVDRTCVHCLLCHDIAPDHFMQTEHEGFVHRQPMTEKEALLCESALANCPVGAIGNNG